MKVSSKDAGWVEMEDEMVTNSDQCKAAINKELEKYNIKLMSIQKCCIIFVIHLLHEKDRSLEHNKNNAFKDYLVYLCKGNFDPSSGNIWFSPSSWDYFLKYYVEPT